MKNLIPVFYDQHGYRWRCFQVTIILIIIGVGLIFSLFIVSVLINPERTIASVNSVGFRLINFFDSFTYNLLILLTKITIIRQILISILAFYERYRSDTIPPLQNYLPSVSVVVPAFNEEKVILNTVYSLLRSNYPNFNIIVVDDGSTDRTYQYLVKAFSSHSLVYIFSKPNEGKGQALNDGIKQSKAEIIITIDADTIVFPNTISKLVQHFATPHIAAVAGNIKVGNRLNLLTYWQALEYITTQNLERRVFSLLNCIPVVPGAIGAWRRQIIFKAGGFTNDTVAEDGDLTIRMFKLGYKINYENEAIALTEAPATTLGFIKQRFRWTYGTLQVIWKHRDIIFRIRYGTLSIFVLPNFIFLQIYSILALPLIDLRLLISLVRVASEQQIIYSYAYLSIFYFTLSLGLEFITSWIAFLLEPEEDYRLLLWLPFQRLIYRQLMFYVGIKSILVAIQGKYVGWQKIERKATVYYHKDIF
ncbi:MAG: glycosyltransferase [Nostoc sp.]|uniref:glycosyltransferase n=1 Tax=Nostoc sp. TaxID=1180 RepID=UPI002FFD465B